MGLTPTAAAAAWATGNIRTAAALLVMIYSSGPANRQLSLMITSIALDPGDKEILSQKFNNSIMSKEKIISAYEEAEITVKENFLSTTFQIHSIW